MDILYSYMFSCNLYVGRLDMISTFLMMEGCIIIINSCVVAHEQLALYMWFLLVQDWQVDKNGQCTELRMFATLRA